MPALYTSLYLDDDDVTHVYSVLLALAFYKQQLSIQNRTQCISSYTLYVCTLCV